MSTKIFVEANKSSQYSICQSLRRLIFGRPALPLNRTSVFLHGRLRIENAGGLRSGRHPGGGRVYAHGPSFVPVLLTVSAAPLLLSCAAGPGVDERRGGRPDCHLLC